MSKIIKEALQKYNPNHVLLMFSGGHDSLCSTHYSATYLDKVGVRYSVYHGNTGTGIKETFDFVEYVCKKYTWDLVTRKPEYPYDYEALIKKNGFPGPSQHQYMYRNLKEKPLRKYITHELKSSPYSRENVLLITGIRQSESLIRMGYKETVTKENSKIWCSPIFEWSKRNCEDYMIQYYLPRNPVKDKICISGECLCGAFAKHEERAEIKNAFPNAFSKIEKWEELSKKSGFEWRWNSCKLTYEKHNPPKQMKFNFMPMCIGCESKQ